jgi:hypothetical protein
MRQNIYSLLVVCSLFAAASYSQTPPADLPANNATQASDKDKRILWIIPNYRTSPTLDHYEPLTTREKFKLARQDAFDRGGFVLAAIFAGEGLATASNPSFGHGIGAVPAYYVTAHADLDIGDYMTEAIFPTLLHQDPRYFRKGSGRGWSRFGYAVGQIFWTHTDAGGRQFNFSEIGGNSTAVAISMAYYPDQRDARDAVSKLGIQLGIDMASNVLKEFWPDIHRKFSRNHAASGSSHP